jgi:hypothetical protein
MKKIAGVVFFAVFLGSVCPPVFAGSTMGRKPPGPTLVAPGDAQDLTGKQSLEFRWSPEGDRSSFDHYDFRLYKGHQTVDPGLILTKEVPSAVTSIQVETSLFEAGQTYAWSVRQIGRTKSRSSYTVFKVVKK